LRFSIIIVVVVVINTRTFDVCHLTIVDQSPSLLLRRRILLTYLKVEFYCNKGLASAGRNLAAKELMSCCRPMW